MDTFGDRQNDSREHRFKIIRSALEFTEADVMSQVQPDKGAFHRDINGADESRYRHGHGRL
jgi:hypothetical protein